MKNNASGYERSEKLVWTEGRKNKFKQKLVSQPTRSSQSSGVEGGGWRESRHTQ